MDQMMPIEVNQKNVFHILVKETQAQQITEWYGRMTFMPQENGETFLDISFTYQPATLEREDISLNSMMTDLSIDCIGNE